MPLLTWPSRFSTDLCTRRGPDDRRPAALLELERLERRGFRNRLEHERPDDPFRRDDLLVLAAEADLAAVRRAEHETIAAADAQVGLAADHRQVAAAPSSCLRCSHFVKASNTSARGASTTRRVVKLVLPGSAMISSFVDVTRFLLGLQFAEGSRPVGS